MSTNRLYVSLLAVTVSVLVGCGAGSPSSSSVNLYAKAAICDAPLGDAGSGIAATVDGRYYYYEGDARYTAEGQQRSLAVEDLFDHTATWKVANVSPALGTYRCSDVEAPMISLSRAGQLLDSALGDCEVTVTEVTEQGMLGRFSATLQNASGSVTHRVEDGCFAVVFADAILDADLDGLADADDGCPFDAANTCAEQPANINSCAVDEQA
jgi:hypothetical protein